MLPRRGLEGWVTASRARRGARAGRRGSPAPTAAAPTAEVETVPVDHIRTFSIIAHVDHGKSTLADTLLLKTGTVAQRDMQAQLLDSLDLERERGITIKLNAARMLYEAKNGEKYVLNLIDTPGHVDFSYEVSRSLAACEGALLVVDASQGVEAQTVANVYLAIENDLEIIPVLNKIDLPGAEPERVGQEMEDVLGIDAAEAIAASAKANIGMDEILEAICERIPPPKDTSDSPLRCLIFDSYYDEYKGVIVYFRVVDGEIRKGQRIKLMNTGKEYEVDELGVMVPNRVPVPRLGPGDVGYFAASIKSVADARVGDTITSSKEPAQEALGGYEDAKSAVYCGLFPTDTARYDDLRDALGKLQLNDAALTFEPEVSTAMGFGFRCGFLGLLHMEIVQERLEREYSLDLITTAPTVVYEVVMNDDSRVKIDNPAALPGPDKRKHIEEPFVTMEIFTPSEYNGTLMELSQRCRGEFVDMVYLAEERCCIKYKMPLAEVITDFFDELKSRSKGYASMEYSPVGYEQSNLVKLDVKINNETVDPLAAIVHRDNAYRIGRGLTKKLKELIPRQLFKIPIQAAIGEKIIASETISALRKDVLAKCYGGDISRKKKLLNKQAEGKKRAKQFGKVEVPQDAFMAVLKLDNND